MLIDKPVQQPGGGDAGPAGRRLLVDDPLSSLASSGFYIVTTVTGGYKWLAGWQLWLVCSASAAAVNWTLRHWHVRLHLPTRDGRHISTSYGCLPAAVADVQNGTAQGGTETVSDAAVGASALSRIRAIQTAAVGEDAAEQSLQVGQCHACHVTGNTAPWGCSRVGFVHLDVWCVAMAHLLALCPPLPAPPGALECVLLVCAAHWRLCGGPHHLPAAAALLEGEQGTT